MAEELSLGEQLLRLGRNQEAAGASGRVLDHIAELRLHDRDDAVDQVPGREVLARTALLLGRVALQQVFVQVAQVIALHAVPVERVDVGDELAQRGGLGDEGVGVGIDLLHGTPAVQATGTYDAASRQYTLTVRQACAPSPGQADKLPFVIPLQIGLLSTSGQELVPTTLKVLTEAEQSWTFEGLDATPVPSLLREFSAPVTLHHEYSRADLLTLLAHDSDPFNRWEAAQRLCLEVAVSALRAHSQAVLGQELTQALREVLRHPSLDPAFKELVLTLPAETYIGEQLDSVDPQQVHAVREALRLQLAQSLHEDWLWAFETHRHVGAYAPDAEQSGRRALAGLALNMLCLSAVNEGDEAWPNNALNAFQAASNMTDRFQALTALVQSGSPLAQTALQRFHAMYSAEALVIDKWFALQAGACDRGGDVLPKVRQLLIHPDFEIKNPNRARSLIFSYCNANPAGFHRADASGYVLWAEKVIEIDAFNPQVAARLARALDRWRKLADPYRSAAREAIARVAAKTDLSSDVREVVSRALAE